MSFIFSDECVYTLKDYGNFYKISVFNIPHCDYNYSDDELKSFMVETGIVNKRSAKWLYHLFKTDYELFKKIFTPDYFDKPNEFLEQVGRYANSVVRSKSIIEQLGACNDWDYFATFTFDPDKFDRFDFNSCYKPFARFVHNYKQNTGVKFRYLFVPEQHKDGAWHLHGLIGGLPVEHLRLFDLSEHLPKYIRDKLLSGQVVYDWVDFSNRFGYTVVEPLVNADKAANYVTKYIGKGFANDSRFKGSKLFISSHGLKRATQLMRGKADLSGFTPVYECSYSRVYKFDKDEYSIEDLQKLFYSVSLGEEHNS